MEGEPLFCPECGTWNRAAAVQCSRCTAALPELPGAPVEPPDEELRALRRLIGIRYRIVKRLGSGGMATVWLARHQLLGRLVVIKMLHAHLAREEEMRERFRREAEAAAQLTHPYICPIVDFGLAGEAVYLVMPYLPGASLADRLARDRTVAPAPAAAIAAQVACALDHAHSHGIVHRDIKPDNILFDAEGHAFVTDFGIATARFHGRLTGTGRAMGTPHYMSPEQAMGKMVDGRSDLYAVGVMLYEMVLGFPPFDGADSYSVGYKQVHEAPVPPDVVDSRTPPVLSQIILRCLAKSADDRYRRGTELADALLGFLRDAPGGDPSAVRSPWVARLTGSAATVASH